MRRLLLPMLAIPALTCPAMASANDEPPAEPLALEEMQVTASAERADGPVQGYRATRSASATRTDTAIHETPQSISVVPAQVVEDIGATRLEDALDYAGGVERGNNFGGQGLTEFLVRGFSTQEFYRNGFAVNRGYPNMPDANTLERIEVLRGPASMLYGRGDPGGTFNIVSKQPQAERRTVLGSQVNTDGLRRGTLDTTGALDESAAFTYRLNLVAEGSDSFRDHVESERYNIAPVLRWQLNDDTALILEGDYLHNRHPLDRGLTRYPNQAGDLSRDRFLGEESAGKLTNQNATTQLRLEHQLDSQWMLRGGIQYLDGSLDGGAVENNGLAADGRTVGRNYSERWLNWNDLAVQANLEGHFDAAGLAHTLLLGVEFDDFNYDSQIDRSGGATSDFPIDLYDPVYGQPLPALTRTTTYDDENLKSYAFFLQDQIALTERLTAQVGARLERFEQRYENKLNPAGSWDQAHNAVSPRFGLIYDLTEELAVYANTSRSFKPNRGADRSSQAFDPEEGIAHEVGVKYELPEHDLSVTAALFHITKENVLTSDPVDSNYQVAAGEARSRGFDISVAGNITPQWRMIGGYAYVDAEVTESSSASMPAGTRLANVPRHSFNLLDTYEFAEGPLAGLGVGMGVKYVGDRKGGATSTAFDMDAYTTVDLLAYYPLTERVRLNLNLNNLFDEEYEERAWGNIWAYPGAPRILQAGIAITL
ncbi:TonB-dependent siderophore receptor [Stutzerimonas frequens]|uniref:TonB-dependent siderophore receptor n=1 Tax=Stutzerimonas frequens TaxID=2968969 RepID=UPI0019095590|nr:TonB-dependent siderophore receptor [Stutzerimonas frequens]MBK3758064.1 TonB-dependent siderophore receptor [Stutzerimonas frequens]MBK3872198.1 TonB-dependent siderophore receptor [Stutzerimonas frequens]MBK3910729.1 TonB-dependent siderophore receptor [Stutzerimonas frequens]MBK3930008.1 TonB-dependent siderophore receptor [Stutzerimonas frequens]